MEIEELASIDKRVLSDKLGFRLRIVDRAFYKDFTRSVDMTPVQYSIFTLVANNEGMPQGSIGEALDMDRASTMAVVDKLEKMGLIERRKAAHDRRQNKLFLTVKGQREIAAVEAAVQESDNAFKNKLSDRQLRDFLRCLDILETI